MSNLLMRAKEFIEKKQKLKNKKLKEEAVLEEKEKELARILAEMKREFGVSSEKELEQLIRKEEARLEKMISTDIDDIEDDDDDNLFDD